MHSHDGIIFLAIGLEGDPCRARATSEFPIHRVICGKLAMFFSVKVTYAGSIIVKNREAGVTSG
jgi:hypothetical protein